MKRIKIGKYTLESLTTGMYKDPFIIFREYIQNSSDAIDEAIKNQIVSSGNSFIKIIIDKESKEIEIFDNGIGISKDSAFEILTDIGNSKKRYLKNKGFRGIGRLGGLSYCSRIEFETSYFGEPAKTKIVFNSDRLAELLIPGQYDEYGMEDVIKEITSVEVRKEENNAHYFRVKLVGVNRKLNLLDVDKVISYIEQTAPIPFDETKFPLCSKIHEAIENNGERLNEYNIFVNDKKIYKPYAKKFYADLSKKSMDEIVDLQIENIKAKNNDKTIAIVWYGKCNLLGTVVEEKVKGLRVRKSGILIGDRFLLNDMFKEDRFNGWIQGEVIVVDEEVIPNARRDDFEKNDNYLYLTECLKKLAEQISNEIRITSAKRNKGKVLVNDSEDVAHSTKTNNDIKKGSNELIEKLDEFIENIAIKESSISRIEKVLMNEFNDNSIVKKIINEIKSII